METTINKVCLSKKHNIIQNRSSGIFHSKPYKNPHPKTSKRPDRTYCLEHARVQITLESLVARYYEPSTAQFVTQDPMLNQTDQAYSYTNGNPVNASDPSGRQCQRYQFATCDETNWNDPLAMNACPSNLNNQECNGFYQSIESSPPVNGISSTFVCDNTCKQDVFIAQSYFTQTGGPSCSSSPETGIQGSNSWQIPAVTRWSNVIGCVLGLLGQANTPNLVSDVEILIYGETFPKGDPNSINNYDINAQHGTPSEGLAQVIEPTFQEYRSPLLIDNIWDPAANLYAGLNSGLHNYGSIPAIPGIATVLNGKPYVGYDSYELPQSQCLTLV